MQFKEMAGTLRHTAHVPSQATAGTTDVWTVWLVPYDCEVTAVKFIPDAAITADGTNFSVYTVTNESTDGTGTADVATRTWAATNSVAQVADSLTLGTDSGDTTLTAGDVVSVVKSIGGTGLTIPDGLLVIDYRLTGI